MLIEYRKFRIWHYLNVLVHGVHIIIFRNWAIEGTFLLMRILLNIWSNEFNCYDMGSWSKEIRSPTLEMICHQRDFV